jgi:hypothetical protein
MSGHVQSERGRVVIKDNRAMREEMLVLSYATRRERKESQWLII